ncbi:MAG: MFS transporter [Chloroflexi bacterium]|nr:MFS transporter [Chloroflexota bacterium]
MDDVIPEHEVRRSFALGVFNGTAFRFAETLIDPPLILTWFVSQLTSSNLLIGLVAPMGNAGWFLPQIFVSTRIQRMERKMPSYTLAAVIRTIAWVLLAAAVWLVDDPRLLLVGFFALYAIARLSAGLAGLTFFDVVAKTIPARRRGSFFAWRQLLGGLLGLGGGWIVKTILYHPALSFPRGHAVLFLVYCAVMVLALAAFALIREPPGPVVAEPVTLREQLWRAGRLWRTDQVYRRYIAARLSLAMANIALPFYGIYAKNVLGAPEGMVGIYVVARVGALLLSNLLWGRLSDRRGNRLVMRLVSLGSGLAALSALALVGMMGLLRPQGAWLPYLALPLFFLDGAMLPAQILSGSNFLLELVPGAERPLYLGLSNTLMGVVVLISGLGGLVVDFFGFAGLFAVSLGLCLAGYVFASGLPEPREMEG